MLVCVLLLNVCVFCVCLMFGCSMRLLLCLCAVFIPCFVRLCVLSLNIFECFVCESSCGFVYVDVVFVRLMCLCGLFVS